MTDLRKLTQLLDEFGVGYQVFDQGNGHAANPIEVRCSQGATKVSGYREFETSFEFDENEKFVQMGAWE